MRDSRILALGLVFFFLGTAAVSTSEAANSAIGNGRLSVAQRSDEAMSGTYAFDRSELRFEARAESPARARVRILAPGLDVETQLDVRQQVAYLVGGSEPITLAQREALQALALKLERELQPYTRELPLHESTLFRVTLFLSEAPVGIVLGSREIRPISPAPQINEALFGCQRRDNDRVTPLAGGCQRRDYEVCHDALFECFSCDTTSNGCDGNQCEGRCGAGCGATGAGLYSQDCADHDYCCGIHGGCTNPFALSCGDEYFEAANDFIFGLFLTNCSGCGS